MPSKNPAQRLCDIVENIEAIEEFTAADGVCRVCGGPQDQGSAPDIDWVAVGAADNIYRLEYEVMDERLLWHTVRHGLAPLRDVAARELKRPSGMA